MRPLLLKEFPGANTEGQGFIQTAHDLFRDYGATEDQRQIFFDEMKGWERKVQDFLNAYCLEETPSNIRLACKRVGAPYVEGVLKDIVTDEGEYTGMWTR